IYNDNKINIKLTRCNHCSDIQENLLYNQLFVYNMQIDYLFFHILGGFLHECFARIYIFKTFS
ncbi:hypothetical protein J9303_19450, partial [Bacillaceae bacterium Marseille-Q3522]|nr:hypothetical protein [Bacillaceae bacterium Marseille-Q3522]